MISATALLHSATALLFRVAGMSVQCFGTSIQYCTVPLCTYCAPSHLVLLIYVGKYLYDNYLNNEP